MRHKICAICNSGGLYFIRMYSNGIPLPYRIANISSCEVNDHVSINGWVKAIRRQKELTFLEVDDGSSVKRLQVVVPSEKRPMGLGYHSSVSITGLVQTSPNPGQDIELVADQIKVFGGVSEVQYPFKARKIHPPDYVRQHLQLRARTSSFSSLLRIRSKAKWIIQDYFNREGFINVDSPLLTSNDCEGGGEVFQVLPVLESSSLKNKGAEEMYFDTPVYLTVSGQLHLEAMVSGLSKVYNFNPAFRAENSQTSRHLSEFWMVEAEECFLQGSGGLEFLMNRIENLIKLTTKALTDSSEEDLNFHWKTNAEAKTLVASVIDKPFIRVPYHEAMIILNNANDNFERKAKTGEDLGREHELFLTKFFGDVPVFVTEWPRETKGFYMCTKEEDENIVLGFDLLFPVVGELVGGGLREYRITVLESRLQKLGISESLNWYLELRKTGMAPSGGFGLGFERYLQFILGIKNIKDTIPFPRWPKNCSC